MKIRRGRTAESRCFAASRPTRFVVVPELGPGQASTRGQRPWDGCFAHHDGARVRIPAQREAPDVANAGLVGPPSCTSRRYKDASDAGCDALCAGRLEGRPPSTPVSPRSMPLGPTTRLPGAGIGYVGPGFRSFSVLGVST